MSPRISIFKEPLLEFRYGQHLEDPHDGLSLFGPFDADLPSHPAKITYGVIGTDKGILQFEKWSEKMDGAIIDENENKKLWPPFPGFEAAFNCEWPCKPAWSHSLEKNELIKASRHRDPNTRAFDIVSSYLKGFDILRKRDEAFSVIICVVPDEVWKYCRPKSRVEHPWGYMPKKSMREQFKEGQVTLFEQRYSDSQKGWSTDKYRLSGDFRRQIKARTLKYNIPIQIIRESTLSLSPIEDDRRGLTCLSDRAWNLSVALYYKAGGKPWKLASARDGVCYIGISFKRTESGKDGKTASCAAQMFLDTGDGIVFLGDEGPWFSPKDRQYHLSRESAKNLLNGILETYNELEGKELKELFIHSRSSIGKEEFEGYINACPKDVKLVGIRVRKEWRDLKLYRPGRMPVIRGTFLEWNQNTSYLWGTGFKPRLETYDGWEVPSPLKIVVQYGDASIEQVAKDIFGLTKLNYNACKLGSSEPVTIMFSDDVGEILISNPLIHERNPRFKFYI